MLAVFGGKDQKHGAKRRVFEIPSTKNNILKKVLPPFSTFSYSDDYGWGWSRKRYPHYHLYRRRIHKVCGVHHQRYMLVPEAKKQQ